jgi:hypothetical protein
VQAAPDRRLDDAVEAGVRCRRHHAQHAIERLAGNVCEPPSKVLPLELNESALQRLLVSGRE